MRCPCRPSPTGPQNWCALGGNRALRCGKSVFRTWFGLVEAAGIEPAALAPNPYWASAICPPNCPPKRGPWPWGSREQTAHSVDQNSVANNWGKTSSTTRRASASNGYEKSPAPPDRRLTHRLGKQRPSMPRA